MTADGSRIFERITQLPEYYPTRTERGILASCCDAIIAAACPDESRALRVVELGAGTASKTATLLRAAVRSHGRVVYAPVDVSSDALELACEAVAAALPEVDTSPIVANYVTHPPRLGPFERGDFGTVHRFQHRQLHAGGGENDPSQSAGPTAGRRRASTGSGHGEGRTDAWWPRTTTATG